MTTGAKVLLMISFFFMVVIAGWVTLQPAVAPRAEKATWRERIAAIPDALIILVIFGIVIGGMITGFFSPTEAGTIGTVAVFLLALVRKEINAKMLVASFRGSLRTSIMTLMLIAGSSIFGHFLPITEIPMIAAKLDRRPSYSEILDHRRHHCRVPGRRLHHG